MTFQSCQITPKEWRWVIAWSIAMLILSCIPYAIAASTAPEGWQFAGVLVNPSDAHTYLAKMRQGLEGSWLFHLTYTPEHHEPVFLYTFYLALGHLAALTQLPLVLIFHLARLAAGFWLLLTAFRFIAHVTPRLAERQLAFVLLASTAGFGWLKAADLDISPIDAWVPEAFVPHMLYANPHFPLATALMLTITQRIVWPSRNKLSALWVGIAATSLTITQPLATITTTVVLMLFLAWRFVAHRSVPWPQIRLTLSAILFSAPVVLYDYWITKTNPVIAGWNAQNITPAPALTDLALGYGLTGLLAVVGGWMLARRSIQDANDGEWLILLWAIATIGLVYLPFALQRRFIHGLHIPLGILAAMGLRHRRQLAGVVVATGMSGMLFVWSIPLLAALQSPAQSENAAILFMRHEEMAAFEWLNQNSAADDVVLASPRVGMFIPSQTKSRPFYGHVFETIDARTKIAMLAAFYRGDIDAVSPRPEFIFYGPSERVLGQPEKLSDLPVRFSTGNVQIYEMPDDE